MQPKNIREPNGPLPEAGRERGEAAPLASEQQFREFADSAPALLWVTGPDGRCTFLSRSWYEFTGQTEAEGLGFGWLDAVHPDDREEAGRVFVASNARQETFRCEYRFRRADGTYRWGIDIGRPRFSPGGDYLGYVGSVIDIDDRKRAEEEKRRLAERRKLALDAAHLGAWNLDPATQTLLTDERFREIFGLLGEDVSYEDAVAVILREDRAHVVDAVAASTRPDDPQPFSLEYRVIHPDGSVRWVSARGQTNFAGEGSDRRLASLDGTVADITERKRAEDRLRESEQRFRALVTATSDVVYRMSPDWSELQPLDGRGLVLSTDVPTRDWMQKNVPPFEHDRVKDAIQKAVAGKLTFELEHQVLRPDGSFGWTFSRAVPILDDDGHIVEWFGMASDVTARKRAEETLVQSERQAKQSLDSLYALVEQCPFGIYIVDAEFRIAAMNRGSQDGSFANVRPVIGRPFDEVVRVLWPESVAADIVREFRRTLDTGESYRSKDFVNPRADKDQVEGYEFELHRVTLPDGRSGVACYYFESTRLRLAEATLRENDVRKDEFLAMLAHELRNPLSAIGNAVKLASKTDAREHIAWAMEVITRQMRHLSRLIDDLLDVSRITRGKIEMRRGVLDASPILESAAATAKTLIEERKHTLELVIEPGNLWVDVDPTRLEQVVVNLLNNAAKYSENEGHIRLEARRERREVVISIRDEGVGILPEKIPQMFELFAQADHSLARSEGGLGIGLTLVKKLVELHGGSVTAASEGLGKGSQFVIRLPAARKPTAATSPMGVPPERAVKRARILVVDDNVDTVRGMSRLLKLIGHDVATAHNGPEAIEAAREYNPGFILLDIGLPGMSGYEVALQLRQEECCKEAIIVAVSGYGQDEDRRRSKHAGFDFHLTKPLDHDALITLLSAGSRGEA